MPRFVSQQNEIRDLKNQLETHKAQQHKATAFQIASLQQNVTKLENEIRDLKATIRTFSEGNNQNNSSYSSQTWNPQQMFKCRGTFVGHKSAIWALLVHGDKLYSGSGDNTIKVWDCVVTFRNLKTLTGHTNQILCLAASGNFLFSGGTDKTIRAWSTRSLNSLGIIYRESSRSQFSKILHNVSQNFPRSSSQNQNQSNNNNDQNGTCFSSLTAVDIKENHLQYYKNVKNSNKLTGILYAGSLGKVRIFLIFDSEINDQYHENDPAGMGHPQMNQVNPGQSAGAGGQPMHETLNSPYTSRSSNRSNRSEINDTSVAGKVSGVVYYKNIEHFSGYVRDIKVHSENLFIASEGEIKIYSSLRVTSG